MHAESLSTIIPVLTLGSDEATHVNDTVFLGTHGHCISIRVHLAHDFLDGLVGITLLTGLDEVSVLSKTSRVEYNGFAILVGNSTHLTEVLHRNGLTASSIVGYSNDDERYLVGMFSQSLFQFHGVNITLERNLKLSLLGLIDGAVECNSLTAFNMTLGGVEVRVAGNDVTFVYKIRKENVLSSTALMCRDDIFETSEACDGLFQEEERVSTSIALVAGHDACPLAVAH